MLRASLESGSRGLGIHSAPLPTVSALIMLYCLVIFIFNEHLPICFLDKQLLSALRVDHLLSIADYGEDHTPLSLGSEFKNGTVTEKTVVLVSLEYNRFYFRKMQINYSLFIIKQTKANKKLQTFSFHLAPIQYESGRASAVLINSVLA